SARARGDSGKILPRWVLPWRETGPEDKAETFAATVSALTAGAAGLGAVGVYVLDPRLLALLAGAGLAAGLGVALVTLLRRALKDDVPEEPLTGLLIAGLTGTTVGLASPLAAGAWVGVHGGYWTVRAVQALLGAAAAGIKGGWNAGNRALSWVLDKVGGR
ncbi:MAG: hypothetical protein HY554_03490, partial [Elusimicrobia bacterium]|nr:hypothetical protein [Elusimicrobiota bacterium]